MTTNVPQVSFGANGFSAPNTQQVLAGVIADIQAGVDNRSHHLRSWFKG
jgi:hypothetical protein